MRAVLNIKDVKKNNLYDNNISLSEEIKNTTFRDIWNDQKSIFRKIKAVHKFKLSTSKSYRRMYYASCYTSFILIESLIAHFNISPMWKNFIKDHTAVLSFLVGLNLAKAAEYRKQEKEDEDAVLIPDEKETTGIQHERNMSM